MYKIGIEPVQPSRRRIAVTKLTTLQQRHHNIILQEGCANNIDEVNVNESPAQYDNKYDYKHRETFTMAIMDIILTELLLIVII